MRSTRCCPPSSAEVMPAFPISTCGLSNPGWLRTGVGFLGGLRGEMFLYTLEREYVFGACTTPACLWKIKKIYWILCDVLYLFCKIRKRIWRDVREHSIDIFIKIEKKSIAIVLFAFDFCHWKKSGLFLLVVLLVLWMKRVFSFFLSIYKRRRNKR